MTRTEVSNKIAKKVSKGNERKRKVEISADEGSIYCIIKFFLWLKKREIANAKIRWY